MVFKDATTDRRNFRFRCRVRCFEEWDGNCERTEVQVEDDGYSNWRTCLCLAYGKSVIHNTQRPKSMLNKKTNLVCYHYCRESVAMGKCTTGHVPTKLNPADLLGLCTKVIPGGAQRDYYLVNYYTTSSQRCERSPRIYTGSTGSLVAILFN